MLHATWVGIKLRLEGLSSVVLKRVPSLAVLEFPKMGNPNIVP